MKFQRLLPFLGTIAVYIVGVVTGVLIPQTFNHPQSKDVQGAAYQRLVDLPVVIKKKTSILKI